MGKCPLLCLGQGTSKSLVYSLLANAGIGACIWTLQNLSVTVYIHVSRVSHLRRALQYERILDHSQMCESTSVM